jgi:molybdate transport system permease protein
VSPVALSLFVAVLATVAATPLAIVCGAWLAVRPKPLLEALLLAPLVLPPVVTGYLLLEVISPNGWLGALWTALHLTLPFTRFAVVLAALVVGFPLYVSACKTAFARIDPELIDVARTLGQDERTIFRRVRLPLALPGVAAGAVLCFARALSEFGATTVVAGNIEGETRTIALAVYALLEKPGGEAELLPLIIVSLIAAFVSLLLAERLRR